jgi:hypothetical protein
MAEITIVKFISGIALGDMDDAVVLPVQLDDEVAATQSFLSAENLLVQVDIVRNLL